jgi:hypothetical protein
MSVSLTEIMTTLQNGVQAIRELTTQISATFPQATALSTSATTGVISFSSSQPETFLTVISASGATFKVALYNE